MRRFPVPSLELPVVVSREATHHMLDVLRLSPGERFLVFDGRGHECEAALRCVENGQAVLDLLTDPTPTAPLRRAHILIGLPKHASMDRALRMATEIGVTDIHPFVAKRSAAKGDRIKRWDSITTASTAQCGRSDAVRIHPIATLQEHVSALTEETHRYVGLPGAKRRTPPSDAAPRAIAIGPEGGLHPSEVDLCLKNAFVPIGLGRFTLRTDTAVALGASWLTQ